MRGHEALVEMRRRGVRPAAVWLSDIPPPRLLTGGSQRQWWACAAPVAAEVYVEPGDAAARSDLRFVVAAREAGELAVYGSSLSFDPLRCESTEVAFTPWERGAGWLA